MGLQKWDEKLRNWIIEHLGVLSSVLIILISLVVRFRGLNFESYDYKTFLLPWYTQLKEAGGFSGLGESIGNYYIPYLIIMSAFTYINIEPIVLIKVFSIIFDYLGLWLCMRWASTIGKTNGTINKLCLVTIIIMSPMTILNSAYWAQCDFIYTAFILWSLLYLIEEKYNRSFLLLAVGFCFKLQTIFVFPVYALMWLYKGRFSLLKFIIIPVAYLLAGAPAILMGRSAVDVYSIYLGQTKTTDRLTLNAPNLYCFIPSDYHTFAVWGIGLTIAIFLIFGCKIMLMKCIMTASDILLITLCTAMTCFMFLPAMHERYSFVYCILAAIYFISVDIKRILIPISLMLVAILSYTPFLYGVDMCDMRILALINLSIYLYIVYYTIKRLQKSKEE